MKCRSCGAEINPNSKICDSCGAQISYEMRREQEQLNKSGCPKCGSSNVSFNREKQGEIRGKKGTTVVRRTIGVCKDCGHTWMVGQQQPKKSNTWLWVLGWIFIFPVPLTILMLRNKSLKPVVRYIIIAVGWIVYLLIAFSGGSSNKKQTANEAPKVESNLVVENNTIEETQPEQAENQYSEDDVVERFVTEFNSNTEHQMSDFEKGNIKQKLFGHANNCRIEMLHPANTSEYTFIVTVFGGNNEDITEDMFKVVPDMIHTLDGSVSEEQIDQCINDLKTETTLRHDYKLGDDIVIDYYPLIFRDDGSLLSESRIEISSFGYANR